MTILTSTEYEQEIKDLAINLIEENQASADELEQSVYEFIRDNGYDHELVDGHQWIIYTGYHQSILAYSDNTDCMIEEFGNEHAGDVLRDKGLDGLTLTMSFYAMLADLNKELYTLEQEQTV